MIAFTHSRVIRRCVIVTLAVWVFALMAGVANACLLHDHEPSRDALVHSVHADAHEVTCNDSRGASVTPDVRQADPDSNQLDLGAIQAGAAGPVLVLAAAIKHAVDDGVHAHGPPSAILFLRLRL